MVTFSLAATSGLVPYAVGIANAPAPLTHDYTMTSTIHFDSLKPTELGLAARVDINNLNLYEASLNPINGYLAIVKITGGTGFDNVETYQVPNFSINQDYTLQFTVSGSELSATVSGGNLAAPVTISGTDSDFTSGQMGIFAFKKDANLVTGTWNNATISEPVPEPGTVALLIAGSLALLGWRFRRG